MPHNTEIKARVPDRPNLERLVAQLADSKPELIEQDDTFFNCPNGRLKLRVFSPNHAELIHYHRDNLAGPKLSDYRITPTSDPAGMREILERAFGISGRIIKRRTLYLIGQTRVHLDDVQGLGHFMELEVVLNDEQTDQDGQTIAQSLMKQLDIRPEHLVNVAYVDLVAQAT